MPRQKYPGTTARQRARNEDRPWSEADVIDLQQSLKHGISVAGLAVLLQRREDEILAKMVELGRSERDLCD